MPVQNSEKNEIKLFLKIVIT